MSNEQSPTFDEVTVHTMSHGPIPSGQMMHLFQASGEQGEQFKVRRWSFQIGQVGDERPYIFIFDEHGGHGVGLHDTFDVNDDFLMKLYAWLGPMVADLQKRKADDVGRSDSAAHGSGEQKIPPE